MMDFYHIMMLIHHKLYDSYKLYYCLFLLETITVAPIQAEMEDKYWSMWNANTRKCETNTVGPVEMQEMQFRVVWTVAGGASLHLHL